MCVMEEEYMVISGIWWWYEFLVFVLFGKMFYINILGKIIIIL